MTNHGLMGHRSDVPGDVPPGIERIARQQVDRSMENLEDPGDEIHDLPGLLREGNDLSHLPSMGYEPELFGSDEAADALPAIPLRRRDALWKRARPFGRRIYVESPDDFVRRYQAYWEAAHGEAERVRGAEAFEPKKEDGWSSKRIWRTKARVA